MLLTDEENPYKADGGDTEEYLDHGARDRAIYLEGAKARLKKVVDELNPEPEHWYGGGFDGLIEKGITHYVIEAEKWQALLEEVK